jgi:phosphatidylglycerophosphate synthase
VARGFLCCNSIMKLINLPNFLTLVRLVGIPIFIFTYAHQNFLLSILGLGFLLLTDYFDGWSARVFKKETYFGSIFDPITDRIVTAVLYAWLAYDQGEWFWLSAVVVGRHLSQTLSIPILMGFFKTPFKVKVKAFPKWVTFYNSIYIFYPLYVRPFTIGEAWEAPLHWGLALSMVVCELKILVEYWVRLAAISRGKHDTFE